MERNKYDVKYTDSEVRWLRNNIEPLTSILGKELDYVQNRIYAAEDGSNEQQLQIKFARWLKGWVEQLTTWEKEPEPEEDSSGAEQAL